ncbi:hypothetical protein [Moorena sp. SIO3A2]|uniref:hypothetical protein n=1 Tax=Moorena sp. SIO3A2 TaxID=2607841 RepID=UPI0013B96CC8|nr:hypothetical protein [Moorena sp. SIO3A2]NER90342.1 hypothetical protein [Moorena sp. SIO3A2]
MAQNYPHAEIAIVQIGDYEIEGLYCFELDAYAVALPQICVFFSILNKNASRDVKALMGKGFSFLKLKTSLHSKAVNAMLLPDFSKLVRKLDKSGLEAAELLVDAMNDLSWHQLFSQAFNQQLDKEEQQAILKSRLKGKKIRLNLVEAITLYIEQNKESLKPNYIKWVYHNVSDDINRKIFGKTSKKIKLERGLTEDDLIRDTFTADQLELIGHIEYLAVCSITKGVDPVSAVRDSLTRFTI